MNADLFARVSPDIVPFVQDVMYTEEQIRKRASEMGRQITDHYRAILAPGEALLIVGLLKGALPFMSECRLDPSRISPCLPSTYQYVW